MELELDYKVEQFGEKDQIILKMLLEKCNKDKPLIYEIGSWTGRSTSILGEFAKVHQGKVVTIDNFQGTGSHLNEFTKERDIQKILVNNMNILGLQSFIHIERANSDDVLINYGSIDFMFIDGDHRYTQVKKDLDYWWPRIKRNGLFCGHDCEGPEYDERYIEEDYENNRHNGVCKAVFDKFKEVNVEDSIMWWVIK